MQRATLLVAFALVSCRPNIDLQQQRDLVNRVLQQNDVAAMQAMRVEPERNWKRLEDDLVHYRMWHVWTFLGERIMFGRQPLAERETNPIKVHIWQKGFYCHILATPSDLDDLSHYYEGVSVGTYGVVTGINPFTKHVSITSIKTWCDGSE